MDSFRIHGGNSLQGEITPQGAKNEALQVLCAPLLTSQPVIIHNIPNILDVTKLIDMIRDLGCEVEKIDSKTYRFCARNLNEPILHSVLFQKKATMFRGSIMLIGPLLVRLGQVTFTKPGGDKIGRRKFDIHIQGLQKLGAHFQYHIEKNQFTVHTTGLKGTYILLDEASITGTANLIMTAVLASGTTTLYNTACEPYIQQLCIMLNNMGAKIQGIGSNLLTIEGVQSLHGTSHTILPDMIEVGSFIGLAAMTQSDLTIKNCRVDQLGIIPSVFQRMGVHLHTSNDDIRIYPQPCYEIETNIDRSILTVSDAPWPGFTPDLLSIILVLAVQAKGTVIVHQKMFESRLFFVDKLIDMGAQIILCDPHRATVIGLNRKYALRGIDMTSPDIRAGVAMLIAALSARGKSEIFSADQIDRGYEDIDVRLQKLGADIVRVSH